jgi:hypothetical protein
LSGIWQLGARIASVGLERSTDTIVLEASVSDGTSSCAFTPQDGLVVIRHRMRTSIIRVIPRVEGDGDGVPTLKIEFADRVEINWFPGPKSQNLDDKWESCTYQSRALVPTCRLDADRGSSSPTPHETLRYNVFIIIRICPCICRCCNDSYEHELNSDLSHRVWQLNHVHV